MPRGIYERKGYMKSCKKVSSVDREKILSARRDGVSLSGIMKTVGFGRATIVREIKRS